MINCQLIVNLLVHCTGVLISPYPDQEGNKLMFLSEWHLAFTGVLISP